MIEKPVKNPPNPLLKKKIKEANLCQEVDYYKEGQNVVDGLDEINISKQNDYRIGRVKEVKAPVGHDHTPIVTHRFIYLADDHTSANKGKSFSGQTEVYDAAMHKTRLLL